MTDPRLAAVVAELERQAMRLRTTVYQEQIDADAREEQAREDWERAHLCDVPDGAEGWL